jgi:hypothetical protein
MSLPGTKQRKQPSQPLPLPPPPMPPPRLHVMPPAPPLPRDVVVLKNPTPTPPPLAEIPTGVLLDRAQAEDIDYAKLFQRHTAMHRIFDGIGKSRAKVGRLVEHLRLLYQLKLVVNVQKLKHEKRIDQAQLNKWVVSLYKAIGFGVLTVIVLALVAYLGSTIFYWYSTSWLMPTVIAPTDEHVLTLSSTLAVQASARDKIAADVKDADRVVAMDELFLDEAKKSIADELGDRKVQLAQLAALHRSLTSTKAEVHSNSRLYTKMSRQRLAAEYDAHLIDREGAVTGAFQLSQIAAGNLNLAERAVEIDKQRSDLVRETSSLAALLGTGDKRQRRYSYEVLKMLEDVKRAEVELAKARDYREALAKSFARYQTLVATIEDSAYLRAAARKDTIAQVPYENLDHVKPGQPLYSCAIGLFFCKKVGSVVAVLSGELLFKHPLHNNMIRGQAVQLRLDDVKIAEKPVLFAGGRPILF